MIVGTICVVFTSVVEFLISAMYIGGVPATEQDSLKPGNARTTEAGNIIVGGAVEFQ